MHLALARRSVALGLLSVPRVPSVDPIYKTTLTTTTNETTTTWTDVDIGTPHPRRVVVLAGYHGVAAAVTGRLNGVDNFMRVQNTAHEIGILIFPCPHGWTATVEVSATSSLRKAVSVYVLYPGSVLPVDSGTVSANTTSVAGVNDMQARMMWGGISNSKAADVSSCGIYVGAQHATLGTFTTTWVPNPAGAQATVTEDVDAQLEAAASYTMGRITRFMVGSELGDVNLTASTSGTKRLAVAMFDWPATAL